MPEPAENAIRIWNRAANREEIEQVYGDRLVRALYGTPAGQSLANRVLSRAAFSRIYGHYQSSSLSTHKIKRFIRDFQIDMNEYEEGPFRSFNDFFIRKFRPGARSFAANPNALPAFAEARYLAFENSASSASFPVKGGVLDRETLLGGPKQAAPFRDGPLLVARLCPTDYHRFHYPDDGETIASQSFAGPLHSVNPLALRFNSKILSTNERQVSLLKTNHFGQLAYVEVGALCVGRIVQTHEKSRFNRGDEKGYFLFGASTVIVLGERGAWRPSNDLLEQTLLGRETFVRLGEEIASI